MHDRTGGRREPRSTPFARERSSDRAQRPRVNLDVEQIVDAAMAIADREGPDALTMRNIAAELGVGVMSLYWYVPTKRDLQALVLERLMVESAPPDEPTGNWREDLASIGWAARRNMLKHGWMVDFFSSAALISFESFGHGFLRHVENSMRMVESLPFDFITKMSIIGAIDNLSQGFTFDEINDRRRYQTQGITESELHERLGPRFEQLLGERSYPLLQNFMQHDDDLRDRDALFARQLDVLLDGVAARLAAYRQSAADESVS